MSEAALTKDEIRCLQLWFRQALSEVERAEVAGSLIKRHGIAAEGDGGHRDNPVRRRVPRGLLPVHHKEMVTR